LSGVPLSSWTVASNGTYETSGFVTPPGGGGSISWNAVGVVTATPAAGIWVFSDGPMTEQVTLVGGNPDFSNPTLSALSIPGNAAGIAVAGPGTSAAPGMVSEAIGYRFPTTPLPAGESIVLWETGYGDQGLQEDFSFLGEDSRNSPLSGKDWTFQALDPFGQGTSSIVALPALGNTVTIAPDGSTHPPNVVVIATADVPLSSVTVAAHTGIYDTWGLALVDATAQNGVACFLAGTAILTPRGPIAVESLTAGDQVVTRFAGIAPVTWVGRRRLAPRRHATPEAVFPYRIRRDAVAPGVPARDLLLSPDHAVFLGGALIPIRYLANGYTIFQDTGFDVVEYWHVELPRHDVLLAEALPAESYLDTGNRAAFDNGGAAVMLHPDFGRRVWETEACARLQGAGSPVDDVRALLLARARMLHALQDASQRSPQKDGSAAAAGRLQRGSRNARM
jgi:hypothetical protein